MANVRKIGLTFAQMFVGCCSGILAGLISLSLVNLMWRGLQQAHLGGFLTALLILISFLIVYGAVIVSTAEAVRQMGRFIPRQTSRRRIYEGSFLGACAVVAVLTVALGNWTGALEGQSNLIRLLGTLFYYVAVIPLKLAVQWIPRLFLFIIAAPIGAAIAYNLPAQEAVAEEEIGTGAAEEQSGEQKGKRKRK